MNILKELAKKANRKETIKTVLETTTCFFHWNSPVSIKELETFELLHDCSLPDTYKEFLLVSNGSIIFKSEHEDDGYKLLGLREIEETTQDLKESGYDIPERCYCFLECLFSDDILLLDLRKKGCYSIIDGDVGYPAAEWESIRFKLNDFFIKLCQCNGAMFWRW